MDGSIDVYRSRIFTFLVGEEKTAIGVHADVFASQSKVLNAMINGKMEEAQAGCAFLPDVSENDFLRFCQYAYTGDYAPPPFGILDEASASDNGCFEPKPTIEVPHEISEPTAEEPLDLSVEPALVGDWIFSPTTGLERSKKSLPKYSSSSDTVIKNTSKLEDCAPVFLAHSRLHLFADKYGIETLKCLALDKLHGTLVGYTFFNDKCEDIVELVRFSYSNDNTPDGANDLLRDLVLQFVIAQQDKVGRSEAFLSLLEEGGPLVRDFWLSVQNMLLK
ncbi:hypothetical protein FKW77_010584 [Venturia effusa]|uniref:BTB domain-containing protein n=1 Tax=Venturia effusa TaxID=50376 RepID=A0A517KXW0_9PEZI|nr:hypothetical protein FKW77_010584 [Venturia effusa]